MQAEKLIDPTSVEAEADPFEHLLEETLDRIGEDARERSESYLEETEVPEGGE